MTLARSIVERKRQSFARRLRGRGLEVGALQPIPVPNASEIRFTHALTPEQLDEIHPGSQPPDIVSDSDQLPAVDDDSLDFVVASEVLGQLSDPIRALKEWHRILRDDGLLMVVVPDKRFTFDHRRRRTPLTHLVSDHHSARPAHDLNRCHLLEWAEHVEGLKPGSHEFERWVATQLAHGYSVHNHVWVAQDVLDLVRWVNRHTRVAFKLAKWCNSSPLRGEVILLLRARKHLKPRSGPTLAMPRMVAMLQHPILQLSVYAKRAISRLRRVLATSGGTLTAAHAVQKEPDPRAR